MENGNQTEFAQEQETNNSNPAQSTETVGKYIKETPKKKIVPKKILKMILLFVLLLTMWIAIVQYISADKYDAVVKVVEEGGEIGVNPMTERLDYGDLPKGNGLMRFVTIENGGEMDVYVKIVKTGNISDLIEINKNNFVLSSGDSAKIELLLEMPISADKEGYEGKVIIFKLPKLF